MTITAAWLQNIDYDAIFDRMWATAMGIEPGVSKPTHFKVSPSSGLTISISAGQAIVKGTDIANQGLYAILSDGAITKTATTAHATLTRIDLVVLEVRDQASNGVANNDAQIRIVAGTAGSGNPPTTPVSCIALAKLNITGGMTTIDSGAIVEMRTLGGACGQIGDMKPWGGALLPTGWDYADGGAISRTTYAEWFALEGTKYGAGNGTTTVNKPDCRGRVFTGMDNMGTAAGAANRVTDAAADTNGGTGGAESTAIAAGALPPHAHTEGAHVHNQGASVPTTNGAVINAQPYASGTAVPVTQMTGSISVTGGMSSSPNTGSGPGSSTPQPSKDPYLALPIIVKVQ